MSVWAAVAVVFLGCVALVLFVPVEVSFRCERHPESKFRCRFGFKSLFGLVKGEVTPGGEPVTAGKKPEAVSRRGRRRRKRHRPKHVLAMLMTKGFLAGASRLLGRLGHSLRVRDLHVWLRAGFDDPADTGFLCAWLMPAGAYLQARQLGHWDIAPVFSPASPVLALSMRARMSVTLAQMVWPVLLFGLTPSTVRGFIALVSGRAS